MTTTEPNMIAVGSIPIHPGVLDLAGTDGKIILFVHDNDEGRSVRLGVEMYGHLDRLYEVRYEDFENVITKMMGTVIMADAEDPFNALLGGGA